MRRYAYLVLAFIMIITSFMAQPALSEEEIVDAPFSPEYLEWLAKLESGEVQPGGHIPFPADLSHLADNPPDESLLYPGGRNRADTIPDAYDLRNVKGISYVTGIKNQNPYGSCWAHSALGAMESNFLMQGGTDLDLSEMHLAYFTYYNADKSKAFDNYSSKSVAYILGRGGNSFYPAALYGRLDGPTTEELLPYPTGNTNPPRPTYSTPESYQRVLRLRDVYYLAFLNAAVNVNDNNTQRQIVKRRIMETGSVVANYYDTDNGRNSTRTNYYYKTSSTETNHAIQIIGWDDSYSRSNFKTNPGMDGAWLIKNSWGTSYGEGGYFWMSYAQYLHEGSAYIVEEANPDMKAYYYDPLGWNGSERGSASSTSAYMANSFKATRDDERVIEVGFYTTANNQTCKISVYTGQGTSIPSSPTSGTVVVDEQSVTIPFAGYHTVTLETPASLARGQYFSVILKYEGTGMLPLASKIAGMSPNYVFQEGSFFSTNNGSSWIRGKEWTANAPLKAFTVTSATPDTSTGEPAIITASLPEASQNSAYSAALYATGLRPIEWSIISGSLPTGLTLNESGLILGTATEKGEYTFTVKAENDEGTCTKELTLTVTDIPTIVTTSVTGYMGYSMNEQIYLSTSASATWTLDKETLDSGLKNIKITESGRLTGKPSKAGTYTIKVYADTDAGTSTGDISVTILAKPTKVTIKTSALTTINVGETVNETLEVTGTTPITFELTSELPDGLGFDDTTGTFYGTPTVCGTYTMKVAASNIYNTLASKDPAEKKIKLIVKGVTPEISTSSLDYGIKDKEYSTSVKLSKGSLPIKWSASGLPKGLTINDSGDISGTPTKAGAFNVTIKAKNNGGTAKTGKIPLTIYATPEIKAKKLKDATTDKAYSAKITLKNEPTTVTLQGLPDTLTKSTDKSGNVIIVGTPTAVGIYNVSIDAGNPAGSASTTLPLTVKGVKPKIKASLPKGETGKSYEGTITITGTKPMTMSCDIPEASRTKFGIESLDELGLTVTVNSSTGVMTISGTPKYSVKSLPVMIYAQNSIVSSPVTKKASLTIKGTKPAFTRPTSGSTYELSATAGASVSLDIAVTGSQKITFTMGKADGFTLTQTGDNTARLTGTAPTTENKTTAVKITAQNADGKATLKVNVKAQAASSGTEKTVTTDEPEAPADSPETEETPDDEAKLILGDARAAADLTQAQKAMLEDEGYIVIATLPEMSVTKSGMYDLEAELDKEAETGAEMFWFAFPQNADESEDDAIAEFYDTDGQEILGVPESLVVKLSVWLNEGVIYEPVIAVKK